MEANISVTLAHAAHDPALGACAMGSQRQTGRPVLGEWWCSAGASAAASASSSMRNLPNPETLKPQHLRAEHPSPRASTQSTAMKVRHARLHGGLLNKPLWRGAGPLLFLPRALPSVTPRPPVWGRGWPGGGAAPSRSNGSDGDELVGAHRGCSQHADGGQTH